MTTQTSISSSSSPAQYWLVRGQRALQQRKRAEALSAFRCAVAADPYHIEALMWLAAYCDDPRESLRLVTRVLALDAHYQPAHEAIRWARRRLSERENANAAAVARPARVRSAGTRRWVPFAIAVSLFLAVLLGGGAVWAMQSPIQYVDSAAYVAINEPENEQLDLPESRLPPRPRPTLTYAERAERIMGEVDVVWAQQDWERAAQLIAEAAAFRPEDPILKRKLMAAYFNRAMNQIDAGELEGALLNFDQALEVAPGDPQVQAARDALVNYVAGREQYGQRNWSAAVQFLSKVHNPYGSYLDTHEMLYRAYYQQGLELKKKKDFEGALKAFQSAVDLDNNAIEARDELAKVKAVLAPPPPAPPGANGEKWIDINLTTQRFRAYQGQTLLYTFVTSTGEPARPTQPGRYQVLDKIPNAYSRFWNLWMPYWMGIYWAGASENGIHALPILSNGQTLWAGYLGRKVSFGCVILDTSAAKLMYNWADIGTPVLIHY